MHSSLPALSNGWGYTHYLCCLFGRRACTLKSVLPLRTLRSRRAFFRKDAQARVPQGSGPAVAEAQRRLQSWSSQRDLSAEVETGSAFMQLKFKMLTLRQIVPQIRSEDWFVRIDLKEAYFHISILPCHKRFLRFAFGGKAYQYWVLWFGLALSPRTFMKCVDAALVPLRLQGIRIMNYIDDWLIVAQSHQLAVWHRDVVLAHMKELRLWLNAKKSVLSPLQRTTFLGVEWDSTSMQACLSPARIESILSAVKGIRLSQSLTVKRFQRLLGLMAASSNVIPFGLLYMRPLQWWLRTKWFSQRGNPFRKVMRRCFRALVMWKKPWFLSQTPVLGASCRRRMLTTDASLTCWGAILEGRSSQGLWKDHHLSRHINRLEMLAVFLALKNFLADFRGHHVLVHSDNTSVVSYINHQGVCGHVHFANWCAKYSCGPKGSCCLFKQLTSRGPTIKE